MRLAAEVIDVCEEYSVPLAIEDFVPCVLASAALIVLATAVRRRVPKAFPVALASALLIATGGFCKATWKLLVASGCWNYPILENLLFPFIAFGFAGLSWALFSAFKGQMAAGWPFAVLPILASAGAIAAGDTWPLLIAAAVAASFLGIMCSIIAFRNGKKSVGVLFIIYVLGTNILPPLAAQPHQSAELQWAEQLTNSSVQLCFLLGALWLREFMTTKAAEEAATETTGVLA